MPFSPFAFDCWLHSGSTLKSTQTAISTPYGKVRILDTGDKSLPPLLMVPDGPCFIEHFETLVEKAKKQYRVVVFDLPGFGYSFPENGYSHSLDEVTQVLDSVFQGLKIKEATLAFSCVNGFYALAFAKKHPERVKALVLIQTPSFSAMRAWADRAIPWPVRLPYIGQAVVHAQAKKIPQVWFKIALPKHSSKAASYSKTALDALEAKACNCLAGVVQGVSHMNDADLKGVTVPTHVIWGTKDHSHKNTRPDSILELVPNAKVHVWEDVGHFANLEEPERFIEFCSSYLHR